MSRFIDLDNALFFLYCLVYNIQKLYVRPARFVPITEQASVGPDSSTLKASLAVGNKTADACTESSKTTASRHGALHL
jgi:hypothetical protein